MIRVVLSVMASVLVMACASAQVLPRHIRDKEIKPTYNEMVVKKYIDSINVVVDVDSVTETDKTGGDRAEQSLLLSFAASSHTL